MGVLSCSQSRFFQVCATVCNFVHLCCLRIMLPVSPILRQFSYLRLLGIPHRKIKHDRCDHLIHHSGSDFLHPRDQMPRCSCSGTMSQHGFRQSAFYKWKAKYGRLDISQLQQLKELEDENRKTQTNVCRFEPGA